MSPDAEDPKDRRRRLRRKPAAEKPQAEAGPKRTAGPEPKRTAKPEPKRTAGPEPKRTAKPEPKRTAKPEPKRTAGPKLKRTAKPKLKRTAGSEPRRPAKRRRNRPKLRAGEAIALVAAILLFILMFFHWYGAKAAQTGGVFVGSAIGGTGGGSAWDTLEVIPLFLMLAIVVTVGAAILRLSGSAWKPAIPPAAAVCVLGILAAVLILIRIIDPPGPIGALSELAYESTLKLPIFLALAAALGIAYGGWRTMGEEGASFASIGKGLESSR